jgi:hypothetical protein
MRISRRRSILGQESLVPAWAFPILATLGVCLLILIVLIPMAVVRTQRGRAAAQTARVRVEGVRASRSLKLGISPEMLREKIRSVVQSERRFSRVEETPGGGVKVWSDIICGLGVRSSRLHSLRPQTAPKVNATCRPRVPTTLFDYGQGGSDLGLFIDLLVHGTESGRRGYGT